MMPTNQTIVTVFLNQEQFQKKVGALGDCFLHGCSLSIETPYDWDGVLTDDMENEAIGGYWIRAGGTGGHKQKEKMNPELFSISVI